MADTKKEKVEKNPKYLSTTALSALDKLESVYRKEGYIEILPFAKDTSYKTIATNIIPDRGATAASQEKHKIFLIKTRHKAVLGLHNLLLKVKEFLELHQEEVELDVLSISGGIAGKTLIAVTLIRVYDNAKPSFMDSIFGFLGETSSNLDENKEDYGLNVEEIARIEYTAEEIQTHDAMVQQQQIALSSASEDAPFLNSIQSYTPMVLPEYDDKKPLIYKLQAKDRRVPTILPYDEFINIFQEAMKYISSVEMDSYYNVLRGKENQTTFMNNIVKDYVVRTFVKERHVLSYEDLPKLLEKMEKALFALYVVQDLIDDEDITDIKITDPYTIRVRLYGRAYLSDITFINSNDYIRFINALIIRNNIDSSVPTQTFTDERDENYILRFSITMPYISSNNFPVLHIRKISRNKLMADDLIKKGMFDEKIRDYLLDCGKYSRGVVFAGPPGSGKTVMLNWFLEDAYEDSAEILVIQENDELFAYRKGVMFQHVVNNPVDGERPCSLEDLGQMALVAGANVFVIGETKGAEICSAITLSNSGCRTALTIHSQSSTETLDKMADLAMRGLARSYEQAKRMLKSFQTIVYLEDFQIQEISEVVGYDEEKKDMIYRPIYRREKAKRARKQKIK